MALSTTRIVSLLAGYSARCAVCAYRSMGCDPLDVGLPIPKDAADCLLYVHRLAAMCDILVLPLGLDEGMSLDIARQVHRQKAPFRTVLFTGSRTATPQSTTPLFDSMLSNRSLELAATLRHAADAPVPPRLSVDAVERQIDPLVRREHCFAPLRMELPFRSVTIDQLMARDRRYVAAMAELSCVRGQGSFQPPLSR